METCLSELGDDRARLTYGLAYGSRQFFLVFLASAHDGGLSAGRVGPASGRACVQAG